MSEGPIRIVIADDHAIFREGLRVLLETHRDYRVIGEATTGREAVRLAAALQPDLLLLDVSMPELTGLEALRQLQAGQTPMSVLVLTASIEREGMVKALQLGARGVVLKTAGSDVLFTAIRAVLEGQHWLDRGAVSDLVAAVRELSMPQRRGRHPFGLTDRQIEIVRSVVAGLTNREIASRLRISEETVKHHLTQVFNKTGVSTRLELAMLAMQRGILDLG